MKTTYNLICMSADGDYVTEKRGFDTVSDAWEHVEDMGSRWFFYPFHFVTSASGKTIIDTSYGLEYFRNKRVKTAENVFGLIAGMPECAGLDCIEFINLLKKVRGIE